MKIPDNVAHFLSQYDERIETLSLHLRNVIIQNLPGIKEVYDVSAKMVAYCYGNKYSELICTIIPSKKGLKLGFNRGVDLPDPEKLLQGTGKISRYIEIKDEKMIKSAGVKKLLKAGLEAYYERMK